MGENLKSNRVFIESQSIHYMCYWTRLVCPKRPKPNTEMPRVVAEKGFLHKAAKWGDGRTILKSASLRVRGLGYLWVEYRVVRGAGEGDLRQEKGEVIAALHRHIWVTCSSWDACSENGGISLIWGWRFWPSDVKRSDWTAAQAQFEGWWSQPVLASSNCYNSNP